MEPHRTNGYVPADQSVTAVSVVINKHKHATHALNPQEFAQVNPAIIAELANVGGHALGKQIVDDIVALVLSSNFSNSTTAATLDFDHLASADKALADRGTPEFGKYSVVNSQGFLDLLSDDTIHSGLTNWSGGKPTEAISTGQIGNVLGMGISRYAGMADNSQNLKGWVASPDAIAIAAGIPTEPTEGNPVALNVETDPRTGLSILQRIWVDANLGSYKRTVTIVYGIKVGQAGALQRLTSS